MYLLLPNHLLKHKVVYLWVCVLFFQKKKLPLRESLKITLGKVLCICNELKDSLSFIHSSIHLTNIHTEHVMCQVLSLQALGIEH